MRQGWVVVVVAGMRKPQKMPFLDEIPPPSTYSQNGAVNSSFKILLHCYTRCYPHYSSSALRFYSVVFSSCLLLLFFCFASHLTPFLFNSKMNSLPVPLECSRFFLSVFFAVFEKNSICSAFLLSLFNFPAGFGSNGLVNKSITLLSWRFSFCVPRMGAPDCQVCVFVCVCVKRGNKRAWKKYIQNHKYISSQFAIFLYTCLSMYSFPSTVPVKISWLFFASRLIFYFFVSLVPFSPLFQFVPLSSCF